ncbi:MAG: MCP four helix bundle domain-containing protein, partial [Thauera sp.]|nr:MCP four helix bundle domain-containing protein [Thauera sp.]
MKNLKIGTRLAIGFGLTLLLLIIVSVVSGLRVSNLADSINDVVHNTFPKTVHANHVIDHINGTARSLRNAALVKSTADQNNEINRVMEARRLTTESFDELERTIVLPEGRRILDRALDSRRAAVAEQDRYLSLLKSGQHDEAIDHLLGPVRTTQSSYLEHVGELITFQSRIMVEAGEAANQLANST